ncbi:hypothetical protein AYJ57_00370 [Salipiger sp. CCB-MM3]|nr:hypothetical protein AYJ57_00370 [Salipiger sp. CCB-MM3]
MNVQFGPGEKGFVTSNPVNPLFKFKANGIFTYDTNYLLPLYVDNTGDEIRNADDGDDILLAYGFDSLAWGATVTDTFTVEYTTGEGTTSELVTITITGVNDDPTAVDDTFGSVIDNDSGPTVIDVLANDFDIDTFDNETDHDADSGGDTIHIMSTTDGANGSVTTDGSTVSYDPDAGFIGVDTFTYTISDQWGATDTATVTVVVGPTNTPPTATDDSYTVSEEGGLTLFNADDTPGGGIGVLDNDSDPENDILGAVLKTDVYHSNASGVAEANSDATGTGDIVFNSDGSFSYDPQGSFNYLSVGDSAYVAFEYTAFDGALSSSDDALVVIEIQGENDDPTGTDGSATVWERGLATGTQPEPNGIPDIGGNSDISQTIDLNIADVDTGDSPYLAQDAAGSNTSAMSGDYGTLTLNANGTVTYLHTNPADHDDNSGSPQDIFNLYVVDGNGGSQALTVTIDVMDDNPFLGDLPTPDEDNDNDVDNPIEGVLQLVYGATGTDTFDYYPGADLSTLSVTSVPSDFTWYDTNGDSAGGEVTVSSSYDAATMTVTGTISGGEFDGESLYTLEINDTDPTASYLFTLLQDAPTDLIPLDFGGGVNPGGPEETKEPSGIIFDGGSVNDLADLAGTWDTEFGDGSYFLNPNNAGGIGVGNGNIEQLEAIKITTPGPGTVSAFSLELDPVGGGIGNTAPLYMVWEAYGPDGPDPDSDPDFATGIFELDPFTTVKTALIDPGIDFDEIYLAIAGLDGNDKLRINNISVEQAIDVDDFELAFTLGATETGPTEDGDVAAGLPDTDFVVQIDGTDDDMIFT